MIFGRKKKKGEMICYEGSQDVLVWKYPCEDFTTETELIVHESQEAVFFKNGQALDSFESGRYVLNEKNIPLLKKMIPFLADKVTPIHTEVYFINRAVSMGILWGTDAPIEMEEPQYHLPIEVTAYGDFSLRVADGRKLLGKLVGTAVHFTQEEIRQYFQSIMSSYVRTCIIDVLVKSQVRATMAESQLLQISREIHTQLKPVFDEYGMELNHFAAARIRVQGLDEIKNAALDGTRAAIETTGTVKQEQIRDELAKQRAHEKNMEKLESGNVDIQLEEERIRRLGSARNAVKREEGMTEAEIYREKNITEREMQSFEVEKIKAENAKTERGRKDPEDEFTQRLQKLKKAYEINAISEEEYKSRVRKMLDSI